MTEGTGMRRGGNEDEPVPSNNSHPLTSYIRRSKKDVGEMCMKIMRDCPREGFKELSSKKDAGRCARKS